MYYKRFKLTIRRPLFLSGLMILLLIYSQYNPVKIPEQGTITQIDPIMLKTDTGTFIAHTDTALNVNDVITFDAELNDPHPAYLEGQFDYGNYLKSQRIKGVLWLSNIEIIGMQKGGYSFKAFMLETIQSTYDGFAPYIRAFILADHQGFEESFFERVRFLGVSHVFALSGLHVTLVSDTLDKGLARFKKPKLTTGLITFFLFLYLMLSGFTVSFIRAFFLYVFLAFNRHFNKAYTALDGLSLIFIISMVIHPFIIFDQGFLLSYSVTAGLLLMGPLLKTKGSIFHVSWVAFLVTLPITLRLNGFVNLTSIIINIPIVLFLGVLFPMTMIVFMVPFLEPLFEPLIIVFEGMINSLYQTFFIPISWPFNSDIISILYYVLLVLFLGAILKKSMIKTLPFFLFMGLLKLSFLCSWVPKLSMLNVDGDAFLIEDALNRCNVLIDGGTAMTAESLIKHLKLHGIKRIDYMVATHNHADHIEGLEAVLQDPYFNVLNIVTPGTLNDSFEEKPCGNLSLLFYPGVKNESNINNTSVVLGVFVNDYKMLFTGDIEFKREQHFKEYPVIDYDLLKVSHHGSITSSSEMFLDHVTPEIGLINLPYYNTHNFPHEAIIERFSERHIEIFQSDISGNVTLYIFKKKAIIRSD